MNVAYLYPGQGFEEPCMAQDWLDDPLLSLAAMEAGADVQSALRHFSASLRRTDVLQPVLVAAALAADRRVRALGLVPRFVAGHSVGELAAWSASGAIDVADAVRIAARRGAAMRQAAERHGGGMVAVSCALAADARAAGLVLAAENAPGRCGGSGPEAALERLDPLGAHRLPVSGPWHSPAMELAMDPLRRALGTVHTKSPQATLVTCLGGAPVAGVPDFVAQLVRPVAWTSVMATLAREGVTDVVAMGCARTLRVLARENGLRARVWSATSRADIDALARRLEHTRAS